MEYMEKVFKKSGWISIIESIIFAILGFVLVYKPEGTVTVISWILGIIFICIGIYKIFSYVFAKGKYDFYNYDLVYGIIAIAIGVITIACSSTIGAIFRVMIGIWIIYSSLIRMSLSFKLRTLELGIWIYSLIIAFIMFGCGVYITVNSGAVIITIGIMMIVSACLDIIEDIIFIKNVKEIF